MPAFTFTSPSGQAYTVNGPDGATPEQAFAILQQQIGGSGPSSSQSPSIVGGTVRAAASGVPIIGALANKMDAATNAALAPVLNPLFQPQDQLKGDTFTERYKNALSEQEGMDKSFASQHPALQVGGELAGGIGSLGVAGGTSIGARLLGLTGPGLIARTAASGASGAALNAADAALRGNDPTKAGELGLATGIAGPLVGRAVGKVVNAVRPASGAGAALPTSDELIANAGNAYHAPEIQAVEFHPTAINDLVDSIQGDLAGQRLNPRVAPAANAAVEDMRTPINGQYFTMEDLTTARQLFGKIAAGNTPDAAAAMRAKSMIDKYLGNVPAIDVTAGDADAANTILRQANADYAAGKTAQALEGKVDSAELQAASANSGANVENALRQRIRSILTSPSLRRGYSPDEIAAMQSIVRGTASQNVLRMVGNLLGGGGGIGAVITGGGAALAGAGPAAALVPAAGYGIKQIGNAIMRNRVQALDELIRSRAPSSQAAWQQRQAAAALQGARALIAERAGSIGARGGAPLLQSPSSYPTYP